MHTRETARHLIPIEDAQQQLGGVSRTTIYRLLDEGHLVRARIGRRAFITGASISAYITSIITED